MSGILKMLIVGGWNWLLALKHRPSLLESSRGHYLTLAGNAG
jgi:hypothetical protein